MRNITWCKYQIASMMIVLFSFNAYSQVPQFINYQGQLLTPQGQVVVGNQSITFCLYEVISGGTDIWCETHPSVNVVNGNFNVALGSITSLSSLKFDVPYYLGITVGGDSEMSPRLALGSVPAALQAESTQGRSQTVDCDADDKIMDALDTGATTIVINGTCTEDVIITHDDVTLQAGVGGGGVTGATVEGVAINVDGVRRASIDGLTVEGHSTEGTGIMAEFGGTLDIINTTVQNSGGGGITALSNSVINITACVVTSNGANGITAGGGSVIIEDTDITNNAANGVLAVQGGDIFIGDPDGSTSDVVISGNLFGLLARSGTIGMINTTIQENALFAIFSSDFSSILVRGGNSISGPSMDQSVVTIRMDSSTMWQAPNEATSSTISSLSPAAAMFVSGSSRLNFNNVTIDGGVGTALSLSNTSIGILDPSNMSVTGAINCTEPALFFNNTGLVFSGSCIE